MSRSFSEVQMLSFKIKIFVLVALLVPVFSVAEEPAKATTEQTCRVAMQDGIELATDIYLPAGDGPFPTILVRTPYNKKGIKPFAAQFVAKGYAVVAQDMRGRFDSAGHHAIIFGNDGLGEHHDGHNTLQWIAEQPWSNGQVVTWGGSALGIVQNMTAPNAPAALKGQIVLVAFSDYYHQAAYQGGVWREELLQGWLNSQGMAEVNLPTFLEHSTYDDFWKNLSAEEHADQVNSPGLFVGGWYDIFLQGTINSFVTIQNQGAPGARGKNFLVIGPIAHGGFTQKVEYPNPNAAPFDITAPTNLIDYWLKDKPLADDLKPVNYYVMGDTKDKAAPGNFWRSADMWPPPAHPVAYHLGSEHTLSTEKPTGDHRLSYKYDPQDPVPTIGGQNLIITKGPMDQRSLESRDDVLVFTSEPLKDPIEVTGRITAKLYIESDCPDTDFTVKLTDVYPDGESLLVTDGIQRASLRNSFEKRELLEAGQVYEVNVDLWSTSLIFNRGHSIRIAVSSSNSPRFEPNPNTGEAHLQAGQTRIATNTIHLSETHPSQILLPFYDGEDAVVGKTTGK